MNKYEVINTSANIHSGVKVILNKDQLRRRKHLVRIISELGNENTVVEVLESFQFKQGEVFECDVELRTKDGRLLLLNKKALEAKQKEEDDKLLKQLEAEEAKKAEEAKQKEEDDKLLKQLEDEKAEDEKLLKQLEDEDKKAEEAKQKEEDDKVDVEDAGLLLDLLDEKG